MSTHKDPSYKDKPYEEIDVGFYVKDHITDSGEIIIPLTENIKTGIYYIKTYINMINFNIKWTDIQRTYTVGTETKVLKGTMYNLLSEVLDELETPTELNDTGVYTQNDSLNNIFTVNAARLTTVRFSGELFRYFGLPVEVTEDIKFYVSINTPTNQSHLKFIIKGRQNVYTNTPVVLSNLVAQKQGGVSMISQNEKGKRCRLSNRQVTISVVENRLGVLTKKNIPDEFFLNLRLLFREFLSN